MSEQQFSVDTDGILTSAPALRELATAFNNISSSISDRLNALGEPWGNDEAGNQFAEKYLGPANDWIEGSQSPGSVLDSSADGVTTMAKGFAATEEQNKSAIKIAPEQPSYSGSGTGTGTDGTTTAREALYTPAQTATPSLRDEAVAPLEPAETSTMPTERLAAEEPRLETTPLQPAQEDEAAEPVQPGTPLLRREVDPMQPATPATPREQDTPASPLLPREQDAAPERFDALEPAERGVPATPVTPTQRRRVVKSTDPAAQ